MNAMFALSLCDPSGDRRPADQPVAYLYFAKASPLPIPLVIPFHSKFNLLRETRWHERIPRNERTRTFRQHE